MNFQEMCTWSICRGNTSLHSAVLRICAIAHSGSFSCYALAFFGISPLECFSHISRNVRIEEIISRRPKETTPTGNCFLSSSNRCTHCHASKRVTFNSTITTCDAVFAFSLVLCDISLGRKVLTYQAHSMNVLLKISMFLHKLDICEQSWKASKKAGWGLSRGGNAGSCSSWAPLCCSVSSLWRNSGDKNQNQNCCFAISYMIQMFVNMAGEWSTVSTPTKLCVLSLIHI